MDFAWMHDPKSEWWTVANVAGTWVAAIGTVLTAIIAVYLASRDRRVDLQLVASMSDPRPNNSEGQVVLNLRNAGARAVTITWIGFTAGLLPRWSPVLPVCSTDAAPNMQSGQFRLQLDAGKDQTFNQPFHPTIANIASLLRKPVWLSAWTLRFWAHTSVDQRQSARVRPSLRRRVLRMAKRSR
jgi:hypothetical protein